MKLYFHCKTNQSSMIPAAQLFCLIAGSQSCMTPGADWFYLPAQNQSSMTPTAHLFSLIAGNHPCITPGADFSPSSAESVKHDTNGTFVFPHRRESLMHDPGCRLFTFQGRISQAWHQRHICFPSQERITHASPRVQTVFTFQGRISQAWHHVQTGLNQSSLTPAAHVWVQWYTYTLKNNLSQLERHWVFIK